MFRIGETRCLVQLFSPHFKIFCELLLFYILFFGKAKENHTISYLNYCWVLIERQKTVIYIFGIKKVPDWWNTLPGAIILSIFWNIFDFLLLGSDVITNLLVFYPKITSTLALAVGQLIDAGFFVADQFYTFGGVKWVVFWYE